MPRRCWVRYVLNLRELAKGFIDDSFHRRSLVNEWLTVDPEISSMSTRWGRGRCSASSAPEHEATNPLDDRIWPVKHVSSIKQRRHRDKLVSDQRGRKLDVLLTASDQL